MTLANNRNVYQQTYTVSVPKKELINYVIYDNDLNKRDLKVFLMLLTALEGYSVPNNNRNAIDPQNFTKVDTERMSSMLDLSEKKVRKSMKKLEYAGIIEKGNTANTKNGYRFTF